MTKTTKWLRRREASQRLRELGYPFSAIATLAKLAVVGGGPVMRYANKIPLYAEEELLAWAEAKLSAPKRSTSDQGRAA